MRRPGAKGSRCTTIQTREYRCRPSRCRARHTTLASMVESSVASRHGIPSDRRHTLSCQLKLPGGAPLSAKLSPDGPVFDMESAERMLKLGTFSTADGFILALMGGAPGGCSKKPDLNYKKADISLDLQATAVMPCFSTRDRSLSAGHGGLLLSPLPLAHEIRRHV